VLAAARITQEERHTKVVRRRGSLKSVSASDRFTADADLDMDADWIKIDTLCDEIQRTLDALCKGLHA
jgi:hypothetical protein